MATVHYGTLIGPAGFSRTVAIKRMHPHFAEDPDFVSMFLDEARIAARVRHPNVVPTLDIVAEEGELSLVLEYVQGETFARLLRAASLRRERVPIPIVAAIVSSALHGLHAAHSATSERGEPLGLVHRDVSPQNIIVGVDGVARVLDFGIAKAVGRLQSTREGQLKGKLAYMAPEQIQREGVTCRTDVYAASIVLWEALAGRRLFEAEDEAAVLKKALDAPVDPPSTYAPDIPPALDAIVMKGLSRDPAGRFATALEMATAIEESVGVALPQVVGRWVGQTASEAIAKQTARVAEIESASGIIPAPPGRSSASSSVSAVAPTPSSSGRALSTDDPTTIVSQPSSISVATPQGGTAPRRVARRVIVVGVAAVVALGVVVAVVAATRSGSSAVSPAPPSSATPSAIAFDSAAVAPSPPAPSPPPPASSSASVAPTASTSAASPSTAATPRKHPSAPPPPPPATTARSGVHFREPD